MLFRSKPFKKMTWYRWLNEFKWQLKYAWQRAYKGYDDTDVFDLDYKFIERMSKILPEFKKNNTAPLMNCTKEETDRILDNMIRLSKNPESPICRVEFLRLFSKHFDSFWII